jgi:hypothetical protein
MSEGRRRLIHVSCMIVIALLYVVSVPWYRDVEQPLEIWFGLPDWVAVALLCYVGVAIVNGIAWSVVEVSDEVIDEVSSEVADEPDDSEAAR